MGSGRHEKSHKPENLVEGHLYMKMWIFLGKQGLICDSFVEKSKLCVDKKLSLGKPALCGEVLDTL